MTSGKMVISEVLQTAPATDATASTPLGTMGGHGISVAGGKGFNYYATEHGWILGFVAITPKAAYSQGIPKKFRRTESGDYYNYKFAHLGEQAIENIEIYLSGVTATDAGTFGYIPRYSEYRYESNRVAGEMHSSLDHFHLGRVFSSLPALNQTFIECAPSKRIFAVDYGGGSFTNHEIIGHVYLRIFAKRLIPKYGKPML